MINKYRKLKIFHFARYFKNLYTEKYPSILIFGNFGAMNLGDESILAGEILEINKLSSKINIVVVSKYPNLVRNMHNNSVEAISLKQPVHILKNILKSRSVIVGGGGLFNKSRSGITGYFYQLYFMILLIIIPKMLNKNVYLLGIGIYENMNKFLLKIGVLFFRFVDFITVRDFHSYDLLKKNMIMCKLYKDNSYLMKMNNKTRGLVKILNNKYLKSEVNIGLSLRIPFTPKEKEYLVDAISRFMIKNYNATFWFYVLDNQPGNQNDTIINNLIIRRVKKYKLKIRMVRNNIHPKDIFSTFRLMDKFISMRLHSMIFANRLKVPFVGISYDIKCSDFLDSIAKKNLELDQNLKNNLLKF